VFEGGIAEVKINKNESYLFSFYDVIAPLL
jgi:hypothetical protein